MKNDLLIKVLFSLLAGGFGLLISLGSYAYSQTIAPLERRVENVEHRADQAVVIRDTILDRVTRTEEQVTALSKQFEINRADTKEADRMRDQKIDKILEQVNQIQRQTK